MPSYVFVNDSGLIVGGLTSSVAMDVSPWCPEGASVHLVPSLPQKQDCMYWFKNGVMTEGDPYMPPLSLADIARNTRNTLLKESDWVMLPDVPQGIKDLWVSYRQALRDITDQPGFPTEIVWPIKP